MPGRKSSLDVYRFGFNGKENDNEAKGEGNQQDYGMRIYDPRVGRFLSVDPLMGKYPYYTPYQFAGNMPTKYVDLDGLEPADGTVEAAVQPIDENHILQPGEVVTWAQVSIARLPSNGLIEPVEDPLTSLGPGIIRGLVARAVARATANGVIGMTDDAARFAAQSLRADHAMHHLIDQGLIAVTKNSTLARSGWGNLVTDVLTNPTKTFEYFLQGARTKGFYKVVNGQDVVLFVTKHNQGSVLQGQVIGAIVPTKAINPDIMKLIGL